MSEKLKPCPFCGCEAKINTHEDNDYVFFSVSCSVPTCHAYPPTRYYQKAYDAIKAWNTRAIDNSEAYKLLHKTLLAVWALIPNVEKGTALDELLVCANEIEKFLSQVDSYEDEL